MRLVTVILVPILLGSPLEAGLRSALPGPASKPVKCCCCEAGKCGCGCKLPSEKHEEDDSPAPRPGFCSCMAVPAVPFSAIRPHDEATRPVIAEPISGLVNATDVDARPFRSRSHDPPPGQAVVHTTILLI